MTFVSGTFIVFVCVTVAFYYSLGSNAGTQLAILVIASGIFYCYGDRQYLILLLVVVLIGSSGSYVTYKRSKASTRTLALFTSLTALLAILVYFKYGQLLQSTLLGARVPPVTNDTLWNQALPIGLSFYIFHAISLIVDAYRRDALFAGESFTAHVARTSLYLMFFPQLIAGPIVRAKDFFLQIERKHFTDIDWDFALRSLILGYFLKMVVADNLSVETQVMTYPQFQFFPGSRLLLLLLAYSCQIYADFFGYSLIAMGLAALFGYRLPINFDRPYIASTFYDFWRRWHISLSSWLRDYLYIPIGGNRRGRLRTPINLLIVMFLGGLWHGGAWNFALWGTIHGVALVIERPFLHRGLLTTNILSMRLLRTGFVFTFVSVAWLFFKLNTSSEVLAYLASIVRNFNQSYSIQEALGIASFTLPIILYHAMHFLKRPFSQNFNNWSYSIMLFLIITNSGTPGAFIYFQF